MNLENRYDFVFLFDVKDGNPNGDPDAGNLPRVDAETGRGLVTDVCLKRKVRNYVMMVKEKSADYTVKKKSKDYRVYIKEKAILNLLHEEAHKEVQEEEAQKKAGESDERNSGTSEASEPETDKKQKRKGKGDIVEKARAWMCKHYYDVRTFGAVMSTGVNCGQVRGPIQLTFSRSVDSIVPQEHSITRMAVTTEAEAEKQQGDNRTMGRKHTVPYGLYVAHGFISAHLAQQTEFNEDDLQLFFESLRNMFEHDRSAARGEMTARGLYVFKHQNKLGNAPAHSLFERIKVKLKDQSKPPRDFLDYEVTVDTKNMPAAVELDSRFSFPL